MIAQLTRATGSPTGALVFASRFLARRQEPVSLEWKGLKFQARGCDWPALQEVLIEGEYAVLVDSLTATPSPIVADIGANIGTFALFALSVAPKAQVYSFEPAAATFSVLDATRRCNPEYRWQATNAAAWSEDGRVSFASAETSTASRVSKDGNENVSALSLATIIAECGGRIDVAKIDIEGAEEAAICEGAAHLARIDTLVIELHPDRCDASRVARVLHESYGQLFRLPDRRSTKPLLLATRNRPPAGLPRYDA